MEICLETKGTHSLGNWGGSSLDPECTKCTDGGNDSDLDHRSAKNGA